MVETKDKLSDLKQDRPELSGAKQESKTNRDKSGTTTNKILGRNQQKNPVCQEV